MDPDPGPGSQCITDTAEIGSYIDILVANEKIILSVGRKSEISSKL